MTPEYDCTEAHFKECDQCGNVSVAIYCGILDQQFCGTLCHQGRHKDVHFNFDTNTWIEPVLKYKE